MYVYIYIVFLNQKDINHKVQKQSRHQHTVGPQYAGESDCTYDILYTNFVFFPDGNVSIF